MTRLEWITLGLYAGGRLPLAVSIIATPFVGWMVATSIIALRAPFGDGLSSASRIEPLCGVSTKGFNPSRGEL